MPSIYDLHDDVRRSFLDGYDLDTLTVLRMGPADVAREAGRRPTPDAFLDGVRLRQVLVALHDSDEADRAAARSDYARLAEELNAKYGEIVLPATGAADQPLGLHRPTRPAVHGSS